MRRAFPAWILPFAARNSSTGWSCSTRSLDWLHPDPADSDCPVLEPGLQEVEDALNLSPKALEDLYRYQISEFLQVPNKQAVVDRLWSQFPEALPAFIAMNDDLFPQVGGHTPRFGELAGLKMPVSIVFGAKDINLTADVGRYFAEKIPGSELTIVEDAGHFVRSTVQTSWQRRFLRADRPARSAPVPIRASNFRLPREPNSLMVAKRPTDETAAQLCPEEHEADSTKPNLSTATPAWGGSGLVQG